MLILTNIILATFAIFAYHQVGNQFEATNRPYIGFESGNDKAIAIIEGVVYDRTPDIGVTWKPEDVAVGTTMNLRLKNYGSLPASFTIVTSATIGNLESYDPGEDYIMPGQVIESRWNYRWTNDVPDPSKELLSFDIRYSSNKGNEGGYRTIIGAKFVKLPTKDVEESKKYPYTLGVGSEIYVLDFFVKETF